jgi:hypothetical protein
MRPGRERGEEGGREERGEGRGGEGGRGNDGSGRGSGGEDRDGDGETKIARAKAIHRKIDKQRDSMGETGCEDGLGGREGVQGRGGTRREGGKIVTSVA